LPRRRFLHLLAGTAVVPTAAVLGQGTITSTGAIRVLERTHYYANLAWPPRSSMYDATRPPCASRSGSQHVKYSSNTPAVTAASRTWLGNAPSPTARHARRTSRGAPQARNLRAFACR